MNSVFLQRIYLEDVDAQGIVYHANTLKFCERARTEMLHKLGISHADMIVCGKAFLVVKRLEIDYLAPIFMDDIVRIETTLASVRGASIHFRQSLFRNGNNAVTEENTGTERRNEDGDTADREAARVFVHIVCVDKTFKIVRIPDKLKKQLNQLAVR